MFPFLCSAAVISVTHSICSFTKFAYCSLFILFICCRLLQLHNINHQSSKFQVETTYSISSLATGNVPLKFYCQCQVVVSLISNIHCNVIAPHTHYESGVIKKKKKELMIFFWHLFLPLYLPTLDLLQVLQPICECY